MVLLRESKHKKNRWQRRSGNQAKLHILSSTPGMEVVKRAKLSEKSVCSQRPSQSIPVLVYQLDKGGDDRDNKNEPQSRCVLRVTSP